MLCFVFEISVIWFMFWFVVVGDRCVLECLVIVFVFFVG